MNRNDITEKIITVKVAKGIKWEDVAKKVGMSKEWVTAGCLGQMTFDRGSQNRCQDFWTEC